VISPLKPLLALLFCLAVLLFDLFFEEILLVKRLHNVRLRICVTGTRGKSSVTRLIASVLRESGIRTLAKTTGSKPVWILPDGTEGEIRRAGWPSILEQKKVLRAAVRLHADAVVAELMSIKPECLRVESQKLLRPQILIITNVRLDHVEDMGRTKPEIAQSMASAIPCKGTLLVPEEEFYPAFQEAAETAGATVVRILKTVRQREFLQGPRGAFREFDENIKTALAVADFLKIQEETARLGIQKARPDFGSLKVFKVRLADPVRTWHVASVFAANDPESTENAILHLKRHGCAFPGKIIGLLNLRQDRGDRSLQWLKALEDGFFEDFERLFFIGDHARALGRRRKWVERSRPKISVLPGQNPQKIMNRLFGCESGDALLIGLGNIGGLGGRLVDYWAKIGVEVS
jgi:poly-gamma-glutamate synthase PgsB/CapB